MKGRIEVDTRRQCKGCARALTVDNELHDAVGKPLGWCGFCKPTKAKKAKAKHKGVEKKSLNFGQELTMQIGATAARSFRKAVEPADSELRKVAQEHAQRLQEWPSFTRETFARLYDEHGCKPLPEDKVSTWGAQAMGTLERTPEWPMLREASQAHRSIATDAGAKLARVVGEAMGVDRLPEGSDGGVDPRDIEGMKQALREMLKEQGVPEDEIENHPAMNGPNQQEHIADKMRQQLQANLASSSRRGAMRNAMKAIAQEASKKAEAVKALSGMGIGSEEGAEGNEGIPEDLIEMASRDGLLLRILKEIGRMQEAYNASGRAQIADGNCDVIGVRPDDDLARLLPFERAKLVHSPQSRKEVISRVLEKQAMCWEMKGEEKRNEGDVVILVDRSGSMSGDRIVWARALAAVLMAMAVKEKRRVALVMFDHTASGELIDGAGKLADGFRLLGLPASGGTNIDAALSVADKMIPDLRDPDCIVISDGQFRMRDEYSEKVKENDGRLFAIMLGGAHLDDKRFDKIWAPNTSTQDAVSILAEVRR